MTNKFIIAFSFFMFALANIPASAQGFVLDSVRYGPDTVYTTPDIAALFPGGKKRMYDYIDVKFDAYADGVSFTEGPKEGSMDVNFVVEVTGRIKYVFIGNNISPAYDEEMVRALMNMPKWEPATVNGRRVRSLQTLRYTLNFYQR